VIKNVSHDVMHRCANDPDLNLLGTYAETPHPARTKQRKAHFMVLSVANLPRVSVLAATACPSSFVQVDSS
jgi:hypothetical protein